MFTQPCFIRRNTPELRGYLEGLGYENQELYGVTNNVDYIACRNNEYFSNNSFWVEMFPYCGYIDCGLNEELFKAIAALRDDSDYLQWFVCDEPTIINGTQSLCIGSFFRLREDIFACSIKAHKASVEELIKHFKSIGNI